MQKPNVKHSKTTRINYVNKTFLYKARYTLPTNNVVYNKTNCFYKFSVIEPSTFIVTLPPPDCRITSIASFIIELSSCLAGVVIIEVEQEIVVEVLQSAGLVIVNK